MEEVGINDIYFTKDWLLGGRVCLKQPSKGYRVSIDSVLLAASIPAVEGEHLLELGSGTGAASLCLLKRVSGCKIIGIENNQDMLFLSRENTLLNKLDNFVTFVNADVADLPVQILQQGFDHVFSNPPYLQVSRSDRREFSIRENDFANVEGDADLSLWIKAMTLALKPKGRLTLIHRADRLEEILSILDKHAGEIVVFPLWPKHGRSAKRVIISARKGVSTPLRLSSGLVLHESDGAYTKEVSHILDNGMPLLV
jgi:tRNA1(Val) A37 N6-methylase TrmN6|tara:strand:+ start:4567 stop:5331 length:765 start_codon:yes stop_codon:yes gene_type:complete